MVKMTSAQLTYLEWPAQHVLLPPAGVTAPHRPPLPHDALTSQLKGKKQPPITFSSPQ